MSELHDFHVETRGGICDLGRVVGVLALLDITPTALTAYGDAGGLQIDLRIEVDPRTRELCLSRLRALFAVTRAAETSGGQQWPCAAAS